MSPARDSVGNGTKLKKTMLKIINVICIGIIPVLLSCTASKTISDKGECYGGFDSRIEVINTRGMNKADFLELLDFLSDANVSLIGVDSDSLTINDLALINKSKVVIQTDFRVKNKPGKLQSPVNGLFGSPAVLHTDTNQNISGFCFNYYSTDKQLKETFYLKVLNLVDSAFYTKYKSDSAVYLIDYRGDRNCFYVYDYSDINSRIKDSFKNQIVILGDIGESFYLYEINDRTNSFHVPLYDEDGTYLLMNRTIITANVLSTILHKTLSKDQR